MATPKRHANIPGIYLVTSRTWQSRALFKVSPPCEIFIESLLKYRDEGRYQLHAFVLMPDHFHILLTPSETTTLERAVQLIKGGSAHAIGQRLLMQFPVWQRGFSDHRIRDSRDYELHAEYLVKNPVKRNLVLDVRDYKWSSASGTYQLDGITQRLELPRYAAERHLKTVP
jgi:putative transposase